MNLSSEGAPMVIPIPPHRSPARVVLMLLASGWMAACGGDGPTSASVAALESVGAVSRAATVGEPLTQPLEVRATTSSGAAVNGVAVSWSVSSGGGSLSATTTTTASNGTAQVDFTLGGQAGEQVVTASVPGAAPVLFRIDAAAGPAAAVEIVEGDAQSAVVGEAVAVAPSVRVVDRFGNPSGGQVVTFRIVSGGGALEGEAPVADAQGIATVGAWIMGTAPGSNRLGASIEGVTPAILNATAVAGPPSLMVAQAGADQVAWPEWPVEVAPAVRVTDRLGNPISGVPVSFAAGAGVVEGGTTETAFTGIAAVTRWTLGSGAGAQTLIATAPGLEPVTFEAEARPSTLNVTVDAVRLNQGTQSFAGDISGVSGRGGVLRAVLRANEDSPARPDVRFDLYDGATLVRSEVVAYGEGRLPTEPDLDDPTQTVDLVLEPGEVVNGLSVQVTIDPEGVYPEDASDNVFPAGGPAGLDVVSVAPLEVVWLPIQSSADGTSGGITAGNAADYFASTRNWIPGELILTEHAPYTTAVNLRTGDGWSELLGELQALRIAEGATTQYYHGILDAPSGSPYSGLAYRPSSPSSIFRSALSYDALPRAARTVGHELGHNLGRRHTPCGNPPGADLDYPHPGAVIGAPGYDILLDRYVASDEYRDYMSYCQPRWTSDYTYRSILDWRLADPLVASAPARAAGAASLLVWGRVGRDGIHLSPAFEVTSAPVLPDEAGPYALRGLDAEGREIFRYAFAGVETAEEEGVRHFAFALPLSASVRGALETLEVEAPGVASVERARVRGPEGAAGAVPTPARVEAAPGGRARVSWNAAAYPMVMIRDRVTGQVLSFARGGEATVEGSVDRIEVMGSDGVGSRRIR